MRTFPAKDPFFPNKVKFCSLFGDCGDVSGMLSTCPCFSTPTMVSKDVPYTKSQLDELNQSCYGKPALFLTVTPSDHQRYTAFLHMFCDPNWPEIASELLPGEIAQFHRPNLCFEVLRQKVRERLAEIKLEAVVESCHGAIEVQRRGLPHCHLTLSLRYFDSPHETTE